MTDSETRECFENSLEEEGGEEMEVGREKVESESVSLKLGQLRGERKVERVILVK